MPERSPLTLESFRFRWHLAYERFIAGQNQPADPIDAIQRDAAARPGRLTAGVKADILMG